MLALLITNVRRICRIFARVMYNIRMKRFNNLVAKKLTVILSSMWLFWILVVMLVVAAWLEPPTTPYTFVMFVISAAFQAVALPVLAVTSNIQGDRQEKVLGETHKKVSQELELVKEQLALTRAEIKLMSELLEKNSRNA